MRQRNLLLLLSLVSLSEIMFSQVTLQPWTQVYGTTPGQALGRYVGGITLSANLPYKASISSFGNTGLYTLQTQNDTGAQRFFFGNNMLTGDLNNDGRTDVVIRRGGMSSTVDTVLVYWGTSVGIDTLNPLLILGENPQDGLVSGTIGDINNDGKPDLILLAGGFPYPFGRGKVYVYLNPVVGGIPNGTIIGDTTSSGLGTASRIADLNNDGFNDLVVRGWNQLGPIPQRYDYINIYWGVGNDTINLTLGTQLRGYNRNSRGLACFDANGDGIADLLWTNRDSLDWVYVHYGGVNFSTLPSLRLRDPQFAVFGTSIINAGDMNGDGFNDVAVAAPFSITSGFVFVYGGGPHIDERFDAAVGMSSDSEFGSSISSVGDVSGDGLADIIVGAPNYEFGNDRGYWGIFKGDSSIIVTDVAEPNVFPPVFKLHQSYPNPFNPVCVIQYDLKSNAYVTLEVFDLLGRRVSTLVHENKSSGKYSSLFDGSRLSSGVYLCRLTAITVDGKSFSDSKKITLIK